MNDTDLAAAIAELAGSVLAGFARTPLWSGSDRGRIAEAFVNQIALKALRDRRPGDPILSEEGDGGPPSGARRCWLVDPLDGTLEYCQGRDDWAVQIGLAEDGKAKAGAVALPARNLLLRSDRPPPLPRAGGNIRILVSRTRPALEAPGLGRRLGAAIVPMGSVGAKVAALLAGEAEIYLHSGGMSQWDSCGPVAVATAAGLEVMRLDGSMPVYGGTDPCLPDLVVSHPAVGDRLRAALGVLRANRGERGEASRAA